MSRIAKYPVTLPKGVEATLATEALSIKGPLGTLSQRLRRDVSIEKDGDKLVFKALEDSDEANAMSGTLLRPGGRFLPRARVVRCLRCLATSRWRPRQESNLRRTV